MGVLKKLLGASALSAGLAFAGGASAGVIPYPNPARSIQQYVFVPRRATSPIQDFFVGSSAVTRNIGLFINGVSTGITGLNNHTSSQGDEVDLGTATKGDVLTFVMYIPPASGAPLPAFTWSSDPTQNSDFTKHIYATDVTAGQAYLGSPVGTYVGWEDEPAGSSDEDYNDDEYIFVNVSSTAPEASTWVMMLAGFGALAFAGLRRARKTGVSAVA